ncbi:MULTISPECIES: hypothetical protein [Aequorivita]|uniref:Uncharacterized protein n=2 Tax=Aequorivita TaxID=153265 RepID=A0AB35YTW2_9FLAO|nr:hypothetical protein [Aequorivita sp. Ant34-E75]WGF93107.1 hypothetical protein QCQ61_02720 [Aequorivita sp. Ant34-E75]
MKNLLTVFAFAVTMLLGVQTTSAQQLSQDTNRPEVIAKTETAKITEALNLNGDQSRAVFRALVAKEVNYQKHVTGKDASNAGVKANKEKFDASLKEAMKKTLTAEQYAQWLKMNN